MLHNLQHFQPCPAQWCRMVLRSRDCLVLRLREVHGQTQVSTLNLKRHCSHCPKFNLPTIPAHLQVKSCPIKPSSETADAPESTRYFVVCFGLSVSLSLHFWGLYRCDPGGIFNACDTVLKILRLLCNFDHVVVNYVDVNTHLAALGHFCFKISMYTLHWRNVKLSA